MSKSKTDFLETADISFESLGEVTSHIEQNVDVENLGGDLSIIGSVCDYHDRSDFKESLQSHFSIEKKNGSLYHLTSREMLVPYYVFIDDEFPIFFTTGRKTEELPETIDHFLKIKPEIGRMWISKVEMENLRQRVVNSNPGVIIPYFTATRSQHSDIPADRRPRHKRTIQYYGKDGLESFEEMKYDYGVLPTNLKFQKASEFKFRVTHRGVFTIKKGGLREILTVIEDSIDRLKEVKSAIDTSGYSIRSNKFQQNRTMPKSEPWAVKLKKDLSPYDVDAFKSEELLGEWEFDLSGIQSSNSEEGRSFKVNLIDERTLGKVVLRSTTDSIRIYPRKHSGIDQSIRVFEFINDQIDPHSFAIEV